MKKTKQIPTIGQRLSARQQGLSPQIAQVAQSDARPTPEVLEQNNTIEDKEYPNIANDPDPLTVGATESEKEEHIKSTEQYSQEVFDVFTTTKLEGESLWLDFVTAFRPHTIKTWKFNTFVRWT